MKYKCPKCGEEHEEWPAIAFKSPFNDYLAEKERGRIIEFSDDFCVIQYEDQTDRFIRAVLFQKVNGTCETLDYGVWVTLSEEKFNEYKLNFPYNKEAVYFGWFYNQIQGYENESIKSNVIVSEGDNRPEVIPHVSDNIFVKDYMQGISIQEAKKRIEMATNNDNS